jgi:dienelactone hydrolase
MWRSTFFAVALGCALGGCGGGSSGDADPPSSAMQRIEGVVSGLAGGAVTLRDSLGEEITVANNGRFAFQAPLPSGTRYSVRIVQSPIGQQCRITGPQGVDFIAGQGPLAIECHAVQSTFEVRATGSAASRQLIASSGGQMTVGFPGTYRMPQTVPLGSTYTLTLVPELPAGCTAAGLSGTAQAETVLVSLHCAESVMLTVHVQELTGSVTLVSADGQRLTMASVGQASFLVPVPVGSPYSVRAEAAPPGQTCTVVQAADVVTGNGPHATVRCTISAIQPGGANPSGTQPGGTGAAGGNAPTVTIDGLTVQRVELANSDGTRIAGYRYTAAVPQRNAAVVLLHGCGGMWTEAAQAVNPHPVNDLAEAYRRWAARLTQAGYVALLVDSFRPRGIFSECGNGAAGLNEAVVRPRDALAGQRHLVAEGVPSQRIALMGWSNGASAVLATMDRTNEGPLASRPFLEAFAFYPGCGLLGEFGGARSSTWLPYAPVSIYHGDADDLWRDGNCTRRVDAAVTLGASAASGNAVSLVVYPGAEHSFDQISKGLAGTAAAANRAARTEADAAIWNRLQAILP